MTREAIERGLATVRLGRPLAVYGTVGSTNDLARAAARAGAPEGLAVVADAQTAGRGRLGRRWHSPPGVNLYCSVLLRPRLPARLAPRFSLLAGVATAAVALAEGLVPRLKWPNDLLLEGRKAAGVLAELELGPAGAVEAVVLGIGLNLNLEPAAWPAELAERATSFAAVLGRPVDRAAVARRLLEALEAWVDRYRRHGFGPVREAWERLAGLPTRLAVTVPGDGGEEVVEGVARGLADDGALLLETPAGVREVRAGEAAPASRPS
ncbi:MAG TPA: biotin--[acetyl-CoA-carboxylase] ligase [Thermodesulfobacteriota bacterium]|nr:biotin--[acetyl-CoA-carboxylase] ligase [Thermodesulfobacteriota bacterium]